MPKTADTLEERLEEREIGNDVYASYKAELLERWFRREIPHPFLYRVSDGVEALDMGMTILLRSAARKLTSPATRG